VVVADVLQGGGNGFDEVGLFDEGRHGLEILMWGLSLIIPHLLSAL
jgi:hypothetical protein